MSGRDGTQHLGRFVGSQTEQLCSGQLFGKGMWGYVGDGPAGVGDQLTGGGTVGGEEEHGDVEAGRSWPAGPTIAPWTPRAGRSRTARRSGKGFSGTRRLGSWWRQASSAAASRRVRAIISASMARAMSSVLCGSPNGVVRSEVGQKSLGEVSGEKDFGGARAGPRQECANQGPSDVIRSWPRDGHARQVGDLDGDGLPIAGADVDAPRVLAALGVVVRENREGRRLVSLVIVSMVGDGLGEVPQRRPQRLGGEVATGPRRAVAVGVTAPEPTQGDRREHGGGERTGDHRTRRQPDRLVGRVVLMWRRAAP